MEAHPYLWYEDVTWFLAGVFEATLVSPTHSNAALDLRERSIFAYIHTAVLTKELNTTALLHLGCNYLSSDTIFRQCLRKKAQICRVPFNIGTASNIDQSELVTLMHNTYYWFKITTKLVR